MEPIVWHIESRKISSLKDYHKNPRSLTKDQEAHLRISLEKFGLIDKPVINLDNTIIGGHQRKRTLKKLGYKEVECNVPNRMLEPKEIEELCIRLNKNTGEWDYDILANEFEGSDLINYGFSFEELIKSSEKEIESISGQEEGKEKEKTHSCPNCGNEF